ncbi:ankyrin repeat-containing protein DDB_G0279043-like [Oscarella lobularis]|uniref:ankyrin repeat-containing protein DDB_G0279043-like n=1 Tax=Oscarella lobularis TaxID=121494 RepID=UPI00331432BE
MAKKLLGMGFSLSERDYFGRTSLHIAVTFGRRRVAQFLIESGADVESQDKWGRTPFLQAICSGQKEFANFLLANGCNLHAVDHEGQGALALACIENHCDAAEWLLSEFGDKDLSCFLQLAARIDAHELINVLLSKGADPEAQDEV